MTNQPLRRLSRRAFLRQSGAFAALTASLAALPSWMPRLAFAPRYENPPADVLLYIFLRGGADGLNMVVPHADADYYAARPQIAIPEAEVLDLDGFFGLHPSLAPLLPIFQDGNMVAVHAVGNPNPTRSHFDAQHLVESGAQSKLDSGWVGRHLAALHPESDAPLRAVGWGISVQRALRGVKAIALQSIVDYHLQGRAEAAQALLETLDALYTLDTHGLADAAHATRDAIQVVQSVNVDAYPPQNGAVYPEDEFGQALRQTAVLIRAEVGLEAACVDLGGWDTHENQGSVEGRQAEVMQQLAQGLAAFYTDLGPLIERVTVVVMSEFGRRVAENGSGGTDHGHGNAMLIMGSGLTAQPVVAQWPTLAEEARDRGDLAITIDYRSVLSELLQHKLGATALDRIFPGFTPQAVGVVAG